MKKRILIISMALLLIFVLLQKQSMAFISQGINYFLNNPFTSTGGSSKQSLNYDIPMDILGQSTIERSVSSNYILNTGALPVYFTKTNIELPDGGDQKVIDSLMVYSTKSKSAIIVWESTELEQGKVYYGTDDAITIAADIRGLAVESNIHYVEIKNLSPNTVYVFKVVSANLDYDNNTLLYDFRTGDVLDPRLEDDIAYGRVLQNDAVTPAENVLITLKLNNNDSYGSSGESSLTAVLTDTNGNWFYDLKALRTSDGIDYFDYSTDGDLLEINVYSNSTTKQVDHDTNADNPVADIILDLP